MRYTEDQKRNIVNEYHDGKEATDLCYKYSISKSTLYNWIHLYGEIKAANGEIITAHRLHFLEKRIHRLTIELEIWRKCKCTIDSPLSQKLEAIENLYEEYGVHACCRVLEVLRSTFYHFYSEAQSRQCLKKRTKYTSQSLRKSLMIPKGVSVPKKFVLS